MPSAVDQQDTKPNAPELVDTRLMLSEFKIIETFSGFYDNGARTPHGTTA